MERVTRGFHPALGTAAKRPAFGVLALQPPEFCPVAPENGVLLRAILQARQIGGQFPAGSGWKPIDHPICLPAHLHQPMGPQIGQVLGYLNLRFPEDFLDVADAKRAIVQQMEDAQPRLIAEALIDLNETHGLGS
jgi:hypothetical protein